MSKLTLQITPETPYLGLASFTQEHSSYFFGRSKEVREVHQRLDQNPLTILYGESGLGKTSLLSAGLIPELSEGNYQPLRIILDYTDGASTPLEQTREALAQITGLTFSADEPLWQTLHKYQQEGAEQELDRIPVLIFDQLEEIFTLGESITTSSDSLSLEQKAEILKKKAENIQQWVCEVSDIIQNRPPMSLQDEIRKNRELISQYDFSSHPLRLIFTLREDYLSHLEEWKSILPALMYNRMALHRLNGEQALKAVMEPAQKIAKNGAPPLITQEAAIQIVCAVADVSPDTPLNEIKAVPPILSLLCQQLNETRLENEQPQILTKDVTERSKSILQKFYDNTFKGFTEHETYVLRSLIEDEMLTAGGHRTQIAIDDAEHFLKERGLANHTQFLKHLTQHRLITVEERGGLARLEITHDVLLSIIKPAREKRLQKLKLEEEKMKRRKLRKIQLGIIGGILLIGSIIAALTLQRIKEQNALLWQASEADCETGIRLLAEGRRDEALAHFERGFNFAPKNTRNSDHLVQELCFSDELYTLKFAKSFKDEVSAVTYAPDNSSILVGFKNKPLHVFNVKGENYLPNVEPLFEEVNFFSYSLNDPTIFIAYADASILWLNIQGNTYSTKTELRYTPQDPQVNCLSHAPDGSSFIMGSSASTILNGFIDLHDIQGNRLWRKTCDSGINSVAYSADVTSVLVGFDDKSIRCLDIEGGKQKWVYFLDGAVKFLTYAQDGTSVLASSTSRIDSSSSSLYLLDPQGQKLWRKKFEEKINCITYAPDVSSVLAAFDNGVLSCFDIKDGQELWKTKFEVGVTSIVCASDGASVLAGTRNGIVRLFNLHDGKELWHTKFNNSVKSVAYAPDGASILVVTWDSKLYLFGRNNPESWTRELRSSVELASYSPDGATMLISSDGRTFHLLDNQGKEIRKKRFDEDHYKIQSLAYAPDGLSYLIGTRDKLYLLNHECKKEWSAGAVGAKYLAFAPDSSAVFVSSDSVARSYDIEGKELSRVRYDSKAKSVAYAPDASSFVVADIDGVLLLFDSASKEFWRKEIGKSDSSGVSCVLYKPDGTSILCGVSDVFEKGNNALILLDLEGRELWKTPLESSIVSMVYAPDGKSILIGLDDKTICSFDSEGQELWKAKFDYSVESVSYNLKGDFVFVKLANRFFYLFDNEGNKVWERQFDTPIKCITQAPNNFSILTGEADGTLRLLDLEGLQVKVPIKSTQELKRFVDSQTLKTFTLKGELVFRSKFWDHPVKQSETPLSRIIQWRNERPLLKTLSPRSAVLLRDHISQKLINAENNETIRSAHRRAPWHPLCPVSLAKLESDNRRRQKFLCNLTLERLQAADKAIWGEERLTEDITFAAQVMEDLGYLELSAQTRRLLKE